MHERSHGAVEQQCLGDIGVVTGNAERPRIDVLRGFSS